MANVFEQMGNYWVEIANKNQTDRQIQFLKNQLKLGELILDLACGSGRHTTTLSEAGFSMVGFDLSPRLLAIAKQRSKHLALVRGDMRFLPFTLDTFSAAISMDTSFGYLPSEEDDTISLGELRRILKVDSVFIIDVFNREKLLMKHASGIGVKARYLFLPFLLNSHVGISESLLFRLFKWKEYPSFWLLQKRTVRQKGRLLSDLWVVCDKTSGQLVVFEHMVRLYRESELEGLLRRAGFRILQVYGSYEKQPFNAFSERLILLASAQ